MTELLYVSEHCSCHNYEHVGMGGVELVKLKAGSSFNISAKYHKILCVREGELEYAIDGSEKKNLSAGHMLLLPSATNFMSQISSDVSVILIRIPLEEQLCDAYAFENLLKEGRGENAVKKGNSEILPINDIVNTYLSFLEECVGDGLRCVYYFHLKQKELFFLLRAYYKKIDLYNFFYPLLTSDISFSQFMIRNRDKVKTVKELADRSNYSLSGFQKRFKKVFGIPAHQWLNEQRSKSILHDINNSTKALKEISQTYGFSSQSYFNDFCKMNFGSTPGQLRSRKTKKVNDSV